MKNLKKTILYLGIFITITLMFLVPLKYYLPRGSVILFLNQNNFDNNLFKFIQSYTLSKETGKKLYVYVEDKTTFNQEFIVLTNLPKDQIIYKNLFSRIYFKFLKSENQDIVYFRQKLLSTVTKVDIKNYPILLKEKSKDILLVNARLYKSYNEIKDKIAEFKIEYNKNYQVTPALKNIISNVSANNSVCIFSNKEEDTHYLNEVFKLSQKIIEEPKYYFISNKQTSIKSFDNTELLSRNSIKDTLYILSKCKNHIISKNNIISLWGAYLNDQDGLIIAPPKFYSESRYNNLDELESYIAHANSSLMYLSDWLVINDNYINLEQVAKKYITDKEFLNSVFQDYKPREFDLYTGSGIQLEICKDKGEFKNNFCYLNDNLNNHRPTVVTAYYNANGGKHSHQDYQTWAKNFLQIPFDLVVFTDKENADWIKKMRGNLPIVIIEKDIHAFYSYLFKDKYQEIAKNDIEKHHITGEKLHNYLMYVIWNEKIRFVNEAININHYKANFFIWCDIGTYRDSKYIKNFSIKKLPQDKITLIINKNFPQNNIDNKFIRDDFDAYQANLQLGDTRSWQVYRYLYDITRNNLFENNIPAGKEQTVMLEMGTKYPELFNLIYQDPKDQGNRWWYGLLYFADDK